MRLPSFIAVLVLSSSVSPVLAASMTQRDVESRARSEGYSLVSKAEQSAGTWDIWASKDGIAYEVKIDGNDGSVIAAVPVEAND